MDTGIHLPQAMMGTDQHHHSHDKALSVECLHCDLLDEANRALDAFRRDMPEHYTNCTALHETALQLHRDALTSFREGRVKVWHGEKTVPDLENELSDLLHRQESAWEKLGRAQLRERSRVLDVLYQPVQNVERDIVHCLQDGVQQLPKTKAIRHAYHHRLRRDFRDAKTQVDELCGDPHGFLTQIELLRRRTDQQVKDGLERLRRREQSRFRHLPGPNPRTWFTKKMVGSH